VSKNVAVFVDVANIFYAAKAAGADIDYVTLLKAAVAGRDFVRAYAYTGLDPENENQRNFHSFLARHGYKVVSKDIRKYGDGKVKANLDIELVVDMMKTARNLDVAIVVSGDGDFAPAIRAVQEMGVRVEVISFRGNTSSDLIEAADVFYDITQIARVDHDSSRSGRRVADDDEDLSMTEVPDKQTEGRGGRGRGRSGRGRSGRVEAPEEAPSRERPAERGGERPAARGSGRSASRGGERGSERVERGGDRGPAPVPTSGGRLVALPGEKLSRAGAAAAAATDSAADAVEPVDGAIEEIVEDVELVDGEIQADGTGRRRRRRGGRGRGRGHQDGVAGGDLEGEPSDVDVDADAEAPAAPRVNQFGSVWDSQIGMAGRPERLAPIASTPEEDDFAEPEIPEYLLAERRRSARPQGGRGGARGTRSAYASAVERERFGGSGRSSRYPEPARQPQPQPQTQRRRDERPSRPMGPVVRRSEPRPITRDSAEPWSEVPPELEELLRAQLSTKIGRSAEAAETTHAPAEEAAKPATRRGGRRKPDAEAVAVEAAPAVEAPAEEKPKTTRSRRKPAAAVEAAPIVEAPVDATGDAPAEKPKRRAPARRKPAAGETSGETAAE
jgi:uncharacterized LabA/DUF88 family protein